MKWTGLTGAWVLSLVSVMAVSMLAGCVEQGPPSPPGMVVVGYDYYYYPDDEVYFYPETWKTAPTRRAAGGDLVRRMRQQGRWCDPLLLRGARVRA